MDAEDPGIGQIVELVGDAPFGGFLDHAFARVGAIAQMIDFVFLGRCLRKTIIDPLQQAQ